MTHSNDSILTALDYIQNQEQLEKEAREALPGKFEKCTFPLGYIRQPLYACKTCSPDNPAGMCYSCSMTCHAEHELFELFPKRHFRCDCGLNDKFNNHPCALMIPAKRIIKVNNENKYGHNFQGLYCRCNQPYEPEKEEGTMFQCILCEDWFHDRCIGNIPESIEDFDCYVCRDCTKKYPFVMNGKDKRFSFGLSKGDEIIKTWVLPNKVIEYKEPIAQTNEDREYVDVIEKDKMPLDSVIQASETVSEQKDKEENLEENKEPTKPVMPIKEAAIKENKKDVKEVKESLELVIQTNEHTLEVKDEDVNITEASDENDDGMMIGAKRKLENEGEANAGVKKLKGSGCSNVDVNSLYEHDHIEVFLQEGWREGLCKCEKCLQEYKDNKIEFLLNEEQTHEPEEDEDAGRSLMEIGMEQLQRIDRVQVLESLMAYKDLASDLKNYFASFKDTGKIVTKEDIDEFFTAKKRERE
ncbi:hypothetical protein G6F57_005655 [Rhizopus arrhizus]|nr:hypothetical protein G6F24_009457 [Rhizopus arrhizus]KAG0790849.1 hypothetical protein G6F21_005508 [Rhizopus arrhizus]KAG0801474.1 hypothetical protein G6F22_001210 [Rhizopus arrhizus]KAG0819838.1 hypothetical protein G6F20_000433 [Rhizopus arrhizus]KAG0836158.1 hypothetical protein G6F19_004391 [Rhizopus arrhizus]